MTTDKARKRAIRTRMTRTGESYTAARRHIVKVGEPEPLPTRLAEPEVSDEAVARATGRGWDDWFRILDRRGTEGFSHTATAAWLRAEQGVEGWWAQSITVGFERARGLRRPHEVAGGFQVGVSKTLRMGVHDAWSAFADEAERIAWQVPGVLRIRTSVPDRSVRFDHGDDGSRVLVTFTPRAPQRTTVTITHERMPEPEDVERMRAFWKEQLARLATRSAVDDGRDAT